MYSFSDEFDTIIIKEKFSMLAGSRVIKFRHKLCTNHEILHKIIMNQVVIDFGAFDCISEILYDFDRWNLSEYLARYSINRKYFSSMINTPRCVIHKPVSSKWRHGFDKLYMRKKVNI